MLHNTILQPFATYEVNQEGRYIKVMSCESEFRLVAWRGAEKLLDSDVVAGAEIALSGDFKRLSIVSETEQKVRLWVSEHKLNYDALSTKPNRANSFVVNHYGLSQKLLPFDPAQASVKLVCDNVGFWVGGEGVDAKSGIYIPEKTIYEHNSAAPLHAYITARPDQRVNPSTIHTVTIESNLSATQGIFHNGHIIHKSGANSHATNVDTGSSIQYAEPLENPISMGDVIIALRGWDKRDLIIADTNGILQKPRNPHASPFMAQCLAEKDGVIYVLGEGYIDAPNEIITYVDGVWGEKACPDILLDKSIRWAFGDPYTNDIWLWVGDALYVTNDDFATVKKVIDDGMPVGVVEAPSFNENSIMFVTTSGSAAYIRDTGELIDIQAAFPELVGATIIGRQWVILAGDTIYTSDDQLKTYHKAYTHDRPFSSGVTYCKAVGEELHIWQKGAAANLLRMQLIPDLDSPKATFRVLKESF